MNRHDRRAADAERRRAQARRAQDFEASLPPAMTPDLFTRLREASRYRSNVILYGAPTGPNQETFSNDYGTFNIAALREHIKQWPNHYAMTFPIVDSFVENVVKNYDVDKRYAEMPIQVGDDDDPIIVVLEPDGQWIADGVHRFLRLARGGRKSVKAWGVTIAVMTRFKIYTFIGGHLEKETADTIRQASYGVYIDRDGSVSVDLTKASDEALKTAEQVRQQIGNNPYGKR